MQWLKKMFSRSPTKADPAEVEALLAEAERSVALGAALSADLKRMATEFEKLSPEDQVWAAWFYALPEEHKQIVEIGAQIGFKATPENFPQLLEAIARERDSRR